MTEPRPKLSLYVLDRAALKELAAKLKELLMSDDRKGLAAELELGLGLAERVARGPRAVDWLLRPERDAESAPLFASLRRVAKKRALELAWTSPAPSLEGRLRGFELLREDPKVADLVDKLLDSERLPWFLVRPNATGGWLNDASRATLASELVSMKAALPAEIADFARALEAVDGDVIAHDAL